MVLPLSGGRPGQDTVGEGAVLAAAEAHARSFASRLGIPEPQVRGLRTLDLLPLGRHAAQALLAVDFLAAFVPGEDGGLLVVNEESACRLPGEALGALVAHETGHAADWLLRLRLRTLGRLPGPIGRRLACGLTRLSPERFADRVAASLVGTRAVLGLYLATFRMQGGIYRHQARTLAYLHGFPDRPRLPLSLRLARRAAALAPTP